MEATCREHKKKIRKGICRKFVLTTVNHFSLDKNQLGSQSPFNAAGLANSLEKKRKCRQGSALPESWAAADDPHGPVSQGHSLLSGGTAPNPEYFEGANFKGPFFTNDTVFLPGSNQRKIIML